MKTKRKKIAHYILQEQLNHGNFGTIYKSIDILSGEERAIKVIKSTNLYSLHQKQAIKREIQIMLTLKHENIVKLYDYLETANNTYLVLEYCKNGDLSQFNSGIGEERTKFYLRQIIKGLQVLYEYNIIHRDLKPANIFLTEDSKIKIGDFGLSRSLGLDNLVDTYVGSPAYMSPELMNMRNSNNDRYNFKSDIWSLGCIVFELITGKRPFEEKDFGEIIPIIYERTQNDDFLKKEGLSQVCIDFLSQIFKTNPEERISFIDMCKHEFILGMRNVESIVNLSNLQCLEDDLTIISSNDALELATAILKTADSSSHPFLLYMKACISLKPFLSSPECQEAFKLTFKKAQIFFDKTDWESSSISRVILETVIQICKADECTKINSLRENFRNSFILLSCLKPSPWITSLKDSIKRQILV